MLSDTPTSAMTVLRLTIKGQKVGSGPIPGNLCPFPKIVGIILSLIAYEITQPIKTNYSIFWGQSPSEMAHTLSVECVSPRAFILAF